MGDGSTAHHPKMYLVLVGTSVGYTGSGKGSLGQRYR